MKNKKRTKNISKNISLVTSVPKPNSLQSDKKNSNQTSDQNFFVYTNLAISFDGKIATKDRTHIDPTPYDGTLMDYHRARADAVLMGASTLRAFKRPIIISKKIFLNARAYQNKLPQPINVVLARNLNFNLNWPFFRNKEIQRILIVPDTTPKIQIQKFEKVALVFRYKNTKTFPKQIINFLKSLDCKSLLLEGGGGIMFPWVENDLIDEWNVTVSPIIIGGKSAPTMVEGEGFNVKNIKKYSLKSFYEKDHQLFLQYVRQHKAKT